MEITNTPAEINKSRTLSTLPSSTEKSPWVMLRQDRSYRTSSDVQKLMWTELMLLSSAIFLGWRRNAKNITGERIIAAGYVVPVLTALFCAILLFLSISLPFSLFLFSLFSPFLFPYFSIVPEEILKHSSTILTSGTLPPSPARYSSRPPAAPG